MSNISMFSAGPHTVLCPPRVPGMDLTREERKDLENHFRIVFSGLGARVTREEVRPYLAKAILDRWGKARRAYGGDTIRSVVAMKETAGTIRHRDSSFVRVCLLHHSFHSY